MVYYCKKCGAIVTGKFCSCCGTRATTDLKDFRLAQSRLERELKDEAFKLDFNKYGNVVTGAAALAVAVAFKNNIPGHCLNVDDFHLFKGLCWERLELCKVEAREIYTRIMEACFPGYPDHQFIQRK